MPPTKSKRRNNSAFESDRDRTFIDWGKLAIDALRLKCNQYGIAGTGRRIVLQDRLHKHFHPQINVAENNNTQNIENNNADNVIIQASDQQTSTEDNPITNNATEPTCTGQINNQNTDILRAIQQLQNQVNSLTSAAASKQNEHTTEIQSINTTGNNELIFPINPSENNTVVRNTDSTNNTDGHHLQNANEERTTRSREEINQPAYGFNHQTQGNDFNFINNNNQILNNENPYVPPPIKENILKKIKQNEFVEFIEILPPNITNQMQGNLGFEIDPENSGSLKIKTQQNNNRIPDFKTWVTAWNHFYQTNLHFDINLHYKLFSYFKIITDLAKKFKFANVMAYDRAHRLQLASQHRLPKQQQTISWIKIDDEIFNMFLRDNYLPQCYHCSTYGHFANMCPTKQKTKSSGSSDQHTTVTPPQNNFRPQQLSNETNYIPNNSTQPNQPDQLRTCFRFNRAQPCSKPPCRFLHQCNKCFRPGHPSVKCPNTTDTMFRP